MTKFFGLSICLSIFVTASFSLSIDRFSECVALSTENNKYLPKMASKYIRIAGTECLQTANRPIFLYIMTFILSKKEVDFSTIDELKRTLPKSWCTSPEQRRLIERFDIRYKYFDKNGVFIEDINIKIGDCKN